MARSVVTGSGAAAVVVVLLSSWALLSGAAPAEGGGVSSSTPSWYLARGDPRLCPSPICGGLFVHLVNRSRTICGDGARRPSCYVATADLAALEVSAARRAALVGLLSSGRALARGALVRGLVQGFPQLDTLVVTEIRPASGSRRTPTGVFRRLRDNRVRCIAAPCFSIDAWKLNPTSTGSRVTVSSVDLTATGATEAARLRALRQIARGDLIASGRIVAVPKAGPAGTGRVFVGSQFYVRTEPG